MKSLYFALALLILSFSTYSQDKSKVRIGIKLAPEISYRIAGWEAGKDYTYTFGKVGCVNGIQVLLPHIETGLYYYQQSVVENHPKYNYDIRYTPRFLHIPILYRQEIQNFYFTAGASFNARLGITKKIENTGPYTVTFSGGNDNGSSVAFGLHVSAGYSYKVSDKINLFAEVRFGGLIHKYAPGTVGIGLGLNWSLF